DMVWLGVIAKNFYQDKLGHLLAPSPNWTAAILFYLVYIAGIIYFAILPSLDEGSLLKAAVSGALLGGLAYATYDMTNLATLKDWPIKIVIVDIIWGMVLTGSVATIGYLFAQWIK